MLHHAGCAVAVVSLLAVLPPAAAGAGSGAPASPSRVVGRVIDTRTRAGIGAARVRLDDGVAATTTAADGTFEFPDVPPGSHRVAAAVEGFAASAPVTVVVEDGADSSVEIEYSLGVTTEVRGRTPESPAVPPQALLGAAAMTGLHVASAVGGLDDVARVMQLRPGVASSQDDRNDLLVRGGGAFETAVRLDGFELPTGSHFAWPGSAGGGMSLIPSAVIGRATIETSGFSVASGERASALLDIDTRTGATSRFRGRADLTAGGAMGMAEGRLPGGEGLSGSWLAAARRSILEFAFSRGDTRATPSYVEALGNLDVPISKAHRLHVLALGTSDGLDVNWDAASGATITGEQTLALGGISLRSVWTPRTDTYVSASWSSNDVSLAEEDERVNSFSSRSLEHVFRARAEIRRAMSRGVRLLAGTTVKRSAVNFDLHDGRYRNEWNIIVPEVRSSWHDELTDLAGYASASVTAGHVQFDLGGRADRSGVTSAWYVSPRGRVEYRPASRWRLGASWGEYRQEIPNVWLGSNAANRTLAPVRCLQATAGVAGDVGWGLHVTVEGFSKRYAGYPIDPSVPSRVLIGAGADFESPLVGRLQPSGRVKADGVDLSLSQRVASRLTLAVGYSYWDVREYNLEKRWIRADYDVTHQARAWLAWQGGRSWTASALWRYASGRPHTPYDVAASIRSNTGRLDRTRTNAATYPAYHRLDVRAERVFASKRTAVTAFVELDNVYNRDNVLVYEWSRTRKQAQPIYQWGLTPVAGVRVEF